MFRWIWKALRNCVAWSILSDIANGSVGALEILKTRKFSISGILLVLQGLNSLTSCAKLTLEVEFWVSF